MEELHFKEAERFHYECMNYTKKQFTVIKDIVNHNDTDYFDFVIFYNNPDKFRSIGLESESVRFIKTFNANIGFCNIGWTEGYDYRKISKKPNEIDERKYLNNVRYGEKSEENKVAMEELCEESNRIMNSGKFNEDLNSSNSLDNSVGDIKNNIKRELKSEVFAIKNGGIINKKTRSSIASKETKIEKTQPIRSSNKTASKKITITQKENKGTTSKHESKVPSSNLKGKISGSNKNYIVKTNIKKK
jgi:hypothetical protein